MKLYVAGKWADKQTIRNTMNRLTNDGHEIIHDWTQFNDNTNPVQGAEYDILGVSNCDCLVIHLTDPKYAYRGTTTEMGCALGLKKPVIIWLPKSDSNFMKNIFVHHRQVKTVRTFGELKNQLKSL